MEYDCNISQVLSDHPIPFPQSSVVLVVDVVVAPVEVAPSSLPLQSYSQGEVSVSGTREQVWVVGLRILNCFVE